MFVGLFFVVFLFVFFFRKFFRFRLGFFLVEISPADERIGIGVRLHLFVLRFHEP